jgi:hypothetical protein
MVITLMLAGTPVQASLVYTPAAVQTQWKNLIDREIAVRGVFTLLGGSMVLVEDGRVYAEIGHCCGFEHGKFLLLRRAKATWDRRERYEGATVIIRGRLRPNHCVPREGKERCYDDQPALTIEDIQIVSAGRAVASPASPRANDLVPVEGTSSDRRALDALAIDIHARLSRNDDAGLMSLFAPFVYTDYGANTFREEYGEARISSKARIAALYEELMSEPDGRARWLFFSTEAGPGRTTPPRYRLFTEYTPAYQMSDAVACFARGNAQPGKWPTSNAALETAKTTDPYVCYRLTKGDGRWWLDFESTYVAPGRFPPVT